MMKDEDYEAMCELVLDMRYVDAVKFIRSESDGLYGLSDAGHIVEKLAAKHPNTVLGQSFNRRLTSQ